MVIKSINSILENEIKLEIKMILIHKESLKIEILPDLAIKKF